MHQQGSLRRLDAVSTAGNLNENPCALPSDRAHLDAVTQGFAEPLHYRKPQPKAAPLRGVSPLIVFIEYVRQLVFGDADATIPDFNAHIVASPPTSEQNSSSVGVSDRIRQQVAHHLREHVPVTANDELGTDDAQSEPSFLHKRDEICSEWLQDFIERKVAHRRTQVSGFQPVHVE